MEFKKIILIVLTTFILSFLLMPIMRKIAIYLGIEDIPRDNRRMNKVSVPKLGGIGIFISFIIGYIIFGEQTIQMESILIGSFIIILVGLADDIKPIKARYKFLGQILGASILPLYGNIIMSELSAFGLYINFGFLAIPITIIFIVAIINCINLIDGMDGLSSGIASVFFLTIGIIAVKMGGSPYLEIVLTFIMLGSTLGFLSHNFHPAKIYLGDTGSMFLGYIIAVIALLGFKNVTLVSFIVPILLLTIPIIDTLCAIIRRKLKGQSIATADKEHLHHQLVSITGSVSKTVLIIYLYDILLAIATITYILIDWKIGIIIYVTLLIIIIWFLVSTSILKNKKVNDNKKTTDN